MQDFYKEGLKLHKQAQGKISVSSKIPLKTKKDICLGCTAGAACAAQSIKENRQNVHLLTGKRKTVAVVSDGSHVLGHGNIGPHASLPSLEAKCALISHFGEINAFPIALDIQDAHKFVDTVKTLHPGFGCIVLEDIEFPKCDIIRERLEKEMRLPVFHNDSQITATITLAALKNALKVAKKKLAKAKIVILGAGVAGSGIARLLKEAGAENIIMCDNRGAIYNKRPNMNAGTNALVEELKLPKRSGSIEEIVKKADVLIGVSENGKITKEMIESMAKDPIVFCMSRPKPEIDPKEAKEAGAKVVATGMFEYENHIDNAVIFPGLARAVALYQVYDTPPALFLELADAIAELVKKPTEKNILPDVFEKKLLKTIEEVVKKYEPQPKKKQKKEKKPKKLIIKATHKSPKTSKNKKKSDKKKKPVKKVKKMAKKKAAVKKMAKKAIKKVVKKAAKKKRK